MKSYSELEIYKKAYHLAIRIHDTTGLYDDDEELEGLVHSLRSESRAVVARITDAWTHRKFMSNIEIHLEKAISEIDVTIDLLKQAVENDIIKQDSFDKQMKSYMEIKHELHEIMERGSF